MTPYKQTIVVPASSIDENGHVNNLEYIRWMLAAAHAHADSVGSTAMTDADGGVWFVRSHHIDYLLPALEGDLLELRTWVEDVRRASSKRRYELSRAGQVLAKGETEWAYVDRATGRPKSIPSGLRGLFGGDTLD
jgi:acyl-CoA thioester hydrolase